MAKETNASQQTGTAVADPEPQPTSTPQTPEEIAKTEQALGLAKPDPKAAGTPRVTVRMGIAPTTIDEAWRMANVMSQSDLVPKGYRGRPADVLVCIQFGMEVGLPPMAALHSIYVTNGRPSLWGDGFLAVIMASPKYRDHDEYYMVDGNRREFLLGPDLEKDDTTAVTTFWRSDSERPRTATFSIAKAKKAGLWKKAGPWQEYPDRMLKYRARGFAGHDAYPDVLRGIKTAEEIIDMPPVDEPAAEPVREVRRLSETVVTTGTSTPGPVTIAPAMPPSEDVDLGAVAIKQVQAFLGGYSVMLTDGRTVDTTEIADAGALEQFIGTKHRVRIVCTRMADGNLQLKSFAIAD